MQIAAGTEARDDRSSSNGNGIGIDALPDELLGLVFSFLPCVRRRAASSVCTKWHTVAMDYKTAAGPLCCCRPCGHLQEVLAAVIERVASRGHVQCLSYLLDRHGHRRAAFGWGRNAARAAAKCGHVACLDYLARAGHIDDAALDVACEAGNSDSVRYLCKTAGRVPRWGHIVYAVIHGSTQTIKCTDQSPLFGAPCAAYENERRMGPARGPRDRKGEKQRTF
nr:ankyrin repeat protein [Pandoravirus massiliensis]